MGCFLIILAVLVPRIVLAVIWLFTHWFSLVFESVLWPLLGFLFMPYSTLTYMGAVLNAGGVNGFWLVLLIIAVIADLSHLGGGGVLRSRRRRRVVRRR